ncbi:MAG: YcnI family protein [Hyphomonadaceae bacterium]
MMKRILLSALALGALALSAPAALAHVVLAEPRAEAGGYYAGFFRISHGCGASPTVAVRIEIPDGITTARPQPKAGWRLLVERETLAQPIQSEGGLITERVRAITWRGRLPADQFDQFGIVMKLPAQAGPIYFRTIQTCADGERRWIDIPADGQAWGSLPNPAPVLTLYSNTQEEHAHDHHH